MIGKAPEARTDALNRAILRQETSRKALSPECDDDERTPGRIYTAK